MPSWWLSVEFCNEHVQEGKLVGICGPKNRPLMIYPRIPWILSRGAKVACSGQWEGDSGVVAELGKTISGTKPR